MSYKHFARIFTYKEPGYYPEMNFVLSSYLCNVYGFGNIAHNGLDGHDEKFNESL